MSPSLVEIRSVTSEIRRRKKKTTAVKYKPFGITMLCGLNSRFKHTNIRPFQQPFPSSSRSALYRL